MPTEVTSNIYANFGLFGLIVVSFFVLVFWVVKSAKAREDTLNIQATAREDKLYALIETLSSELPEIKRAIEDIGRRIK